MKKSLAVLMVLMFMATAWTGFGEELVRRAAFGSSIRVDLGDGDSLFLDRRLGQRADQRIVDGYAIAATGQALATRQGSEVHP